MLADGTKVSKAATLLALDESGNEASVTLFAPLYAKKGAISGLLWINAANRTITTDIVDDWYLLWNNPGKRGEDGFSQLLHVRGGFYGKGINLDPTYWFGADVTGTAWFIPAGDAYQWIAQPDGVAVTGSGTRLTIAKSQKPKKITDKETREMWYDYDEANPCNATISFAARTGIFKGKYALYCDYEDANGKLVHKAVSVPYFGIMTPIREAAFADAPIGMGYSLIPESDPSLKALKLKRSRPVWLK